MQALDFWSHHFRFFLLTNRTVSKVKKFSVVLECCNRWFFFNTYQLSAFSNHSKTTTLSKRLTSKNLFAKSFKIWQTYDLALSDLKTHSINQKKNIGFQKTDRYGIHLYQMFHIYWKYSKKSTSSILSEKWYCLTTKRKSASHELPSIRPYRFLVINI